jgi:hypothetical protein
LALALAGSLPVAKAVENRGLHTGDRKAARWSAGRRRASVVAGAARRKAGDVMDAPFGAPPPSHQRFARDVFRNPARPAARGNDFSYLHPHPEKKFMAETAASPLQPHGKRRHSTRNYERRLKVAGLHDDKIPDDADEFRRAFTRRIYMFINAWHGCPELLCARNRSCMAPNNDCANFGPPTAETVETSWPRVRAEVYNAVKEHIAAQGGDEG